MVQVTLNTEPKQILAFSNGLFTGRKERKALVEAIFAKGSRNSLLRIASVLNSKEAKSIKAAYESRMHFTVAIELLAVFPKTKGFIPVRNWLVATLLKAPLEFLMDRRQLVDMGENKEYVWWPRASLKRRVELDYFFERVKRVQKGKFLPVLAHDPVFFNGLTDEQKKIVVSAM